jgi:hypothetical protein
VTNTAQGYVTGPAYVDLTGVQASFAVVIRYPPTNAFSVTSGGVVFKLTTGLGQSDLLIQLKNFKTKVVSGPIQGSTLPILPAAPILFTMPDNSATATAVIKPPDTAGGMPTIIIATLLPTVFNTRGFPYDLVAQSVPGGTPITVPAGTDSQSLAGVVGQTGVTVTLQSKGTSIGKPLSVLSSGSTSSASFFAVTPEVSMLVSRTSTENGGALLTITSVITGAVPVQTHVPGGAPGQQVNAIVIPPASTIQAGGRSTPSASYPLTTGMTVMLQSMNIVNYYLANGQDMCSITCRLKSDGDWCPLYGNKSSDGCIQSTMEVFKGYNDKTGQRFTSVLSQGFGMAGPCATNAAVSGVTDGDNTWNSVNSGLVVSLHPYDAADGNTYSMKLHLTGTENYRDGMMKDLDGTLWPAAGVEYYLSLAPIAVTVPGQYPQYNSAVNLWSSGASAGQWTNVGTDGSLYILYPTKVPSKWHIHPSASSSSTAPEYKLYNQSPVDGSWNELAMHMTPTDSDNVHSGICNALGSSSPPGCSDGFGFGPPCLTDTWRFVVTESPEPSLCNLPTSTGCPPATNGACLLSQTAPGAVMCPECCYGKSCALPNSTSQPLASAVPPGWVLCSQNPDPFDVANTLQFQCGSLPAQPITDCLHGLPTCTLFNANSTSGAICRAFCDIDPVACDAGKNSACGVGLDDPGAALTAVLKTPECSCINLNESTMPYTGLALDYPAFQKFMQTNNVTALTALQGKCWWPPCTSPTSSVLALSTSAALAGCPPDVTTCFTNVGKIVGNDSKVIVEAANKCAGGNAGSIPASPGSSPVSPDNGTTSSAPASMATKPFWKQSWFIPVCVVVGIILLIIILAVVFARRSPPPPLPVAARGNGPAPTPTPTPTPTPPSVASVAPQRTV